MSLHVCASCTTRYAAGLEACPNCRSRERVQEASPLLPALTVVCDNPECMAYRKPRQVFLRQVALDVIAVPQVLLCARCGWEMKGEFTMPKITRHGGATNKNEPPPRHAVTSTTGETARFAQVTEYNLTPEPEPAEGGDDLSPGSSSETSSERPQTSPETSDPALPRPARTTASRSKRGRAASSIAATTATSGPETATEEG